VPFKTKWHHHHWNALAKLLEGKATGTWWLDTYIDSDRMKNIIVTMEDEEWVFLKLQLGKEFEEFDVAPPYATWDMSGVSDMSNMFKDCNHLTHIDLSRWIIADELDV